MTRDFAGITQESVQLPDLLTLAWAQHLTSSGEQAALVGTGAFSQREFSPRTRGVALGKDAFDFQVEMTACLTWFLPPGQIFVP